jgi:hypothetical protein
MVLKNVQCFINYYSSMIIPECPLPPKKNLKKVRKKFEKSLKTKSPDPKPSSNSDLPVAWITGPATDPSFFFKNDPLKIIC